MFKTKKKPPFLPRRGDLEGSITDRSTRSSSPGLPSPADRRTVPPPVPVKSDVSGAAPTGFSRPDRNKTTAGFTTPLSGKIDNPRPLRPIPGIPDRSDNPGSPRGGPIGRTLPWEKDTSQPSRTPSVNRSGEAGAKGGVGIEPRNQSQREPDCLPYYHSNIRNRDEAIEVLERHLNNPGSFLVRKSEGAGGSYTVSVVHGGEIFHFRLHTVERRYMLRDEKFDKISDLIKYYAKISVPNQDNVINLCLSIPVDRLATQYAQQQEQAKQQQLQQQQQDFQQSRRQETGPLNPSQKPNQKQWQQTGKVPGDSPRRKGVYLTTQVGEKRPAVGGAAVSRMDSEGGYERLGHHLSSEPETPESLYYSSIVEDESQLDRLIQHLYMTEPQGPVRCDCGLLLEESELPQCWSFHISREASTYGRVFFAAPDGTTTWNLPAIVSADLEPSHKERLLKVLMASCQYISSSHYQDIQEFRHGMKEASLDQEVSVTRKMSCPRTNSSTSSTYDDGELSDRMRQLRVIPTSTSSEASIDEEPNNEAKQVRDRLRSDNSAGKRSTVTPISPRGGRNSSFQENRTSSIGARNPSSGSEDYLETDAYGKWQASNSGNASSEYLILGQNQESLNRASVSPDQDIKEALMNMLGNLDGGYLKYPPKDVVRRIVDGDDYSEVGSCINPVRATKTSPRIDPAINRVALKSPVFGNERQSASGGLGGKPEVVRRRDNEPNASNSGQRDAAQVKDIPRYMPMNKVFPNNKR